MKLLRPIKANTIRELLRGDKMGKKMRGFTLVELMVVILIVGILAAVTLPLMQGHIDRAKWSEACATAGAIRRAVRTYTVETNVVAAQGLAGSDLADATTQAALGFVPIDLEGVHFSAGDYTIAEVDGTGVASITATGGSKPTSPIGTYMLELGGRWTRQ
jgi:type IV pilus assembly protein PilA